MNDDIRLIKQIVRETVVEILETEFYDNFFALLDAFESGIVGFRQALGVKKGIAAAVKEETFNCLNFEAAKGNRIGEFEVAAKDKNPETKWLQAYNILKQANASIGNRYHGEGYQFSYWLYGEKIYRQKLKAKTALNV